MNTTSLIKYWTMDRATRGPDGRFRSVDDLRADFGSTLGESTEDDPDLGVQVRGADDEEWESLPTRPEPPSEET